MRSGSRPVEEVVKAALQELWDTTGDLDDINIDQSNPFLAAMALEVILQRQRTILGHIALLLGGGTKFKLNSPAKRRSAYSRDGQAHLMRSLPISGVKANGLGSGEPPNPPLGS